jgi:hypothetical protein
MKECERKSVQNKDDKETSEKIEKEPVVCNCGEKKSGKNVQEEVPGGLNGAQAAEKVYHLYDIEVTRPNLPTFESLMQVCHKSALHICTFEFIFSKYVISKRTIYK